MGKWVICNPIDNGHELDSAMHRYDREIGFAVSVEEQGEISRYPRLAEAERLARSLARGTRTRANMQTVMRQALLEQYCLETHQDEPYTRWHMRFIDGVMNLQCH